MNRGFCPRRLSANGFVAKLFWKQADKLAEEIKELSGDEASSRIA